MKPQHSVAVALAFCLTATSTHLLAEKPTTFSVTIDRGEDLGQCFGSLFEATSQDGAVVVGAGFQNAYNTRYRADRHAIQFYIRPTNGQREVTIEELPRPTDNMTGAYVFERDGTIYSTYGGVKTWSEEKKSWVESSGKGGTNETMRVGNGILVFGNSQVTWNGKPILNPPDEGSYQLFFYANGYLCFYHVNRHGRPYRLYKNDEDGFSRLYACPWTPAQGKVDLSKAITLRLPVVGETTFAWGQLNDQIVTGSNIGGFYVFQDDAWKMILEPNIGVSYQLYSTLSFQNQLLMGQYPTGRVFAYDGKQITDQEGWPPILDGVSSSAREAQTTTIYGGDVLVGVWPWAEVWRYNSDSSRWSFMKRMFTHPKLSNKITHPYDVENRDNSPRNLWGQRVTSLVPSGADLFITTSAKAPFVWNPEKYPFLAADNKWKSYGKVYRARMPGHLSATTKWTDGSTKLEFTIDGSGMSIRQDGTTLAKCPLSGSLGKQTAKASFSKVRWGSGIYGPNKGESLKGSIEGP